MRDGVIRKFVCLSSVLLAIVSAVACGLVSAHAAGVVGSGTAASCTEAAFDAALSGGGVVTFNCGSQPKTIILNFTKQIAQNTEIQGGNLITLSGGNVVSHFQVFFGATLTLRDLTLSRGYGAFGGAIENFGTLSLINSQVTLNTTTDSGGAIMNHGRLNLKDSTIADNEARNFGGGLYSDGGEVTIDGGQISDNVVFDAGDNGTGGGVWNSGTLQIKNAVLARNHCHRYGGGGIYNMGTLNLDRTTLEDNVTISSASDGDGGGLNHSAGTATLSRVVFRNNSARNYGGALYIADGASLTANEAIFTGNHCDQTGGAVSNSGDFTLTNSLIQGNTAGSSAGLANGLVGAGKNTATLINVTVSGNVTSGSSAGGVQSDKGSVTLTYCTIVGNQGGGVSTDGGNITMKNSIVAGNVPKNCPTFVTTNGFNIADDSSCPFNGVGDQENVDPSLGPLADNGGPTLSYMPQAGSPAIDTAQCLLDTTTDQRGAPRPFGDACDVGAVEYGAQVPGAQAMPLPESQLAFAPASSSTPVLNIDPALANPIGIGTVAADGDTLDIRIGTIGFSGPADVYFAVYSPQVLGSDILLYTGTAFVTLSQAGLVPWMASTTGPVDQDLFGAISISLLPSGVYTLFFAVAPDGSQLATFYLWSASFTVP